MKKFHQINLLTDYYQCHQRIFGPSPIAASDCLRLETTDEYEEQSRGIGSLCNGVFVSHCIPLKQTSQRHVLIACSACLCSIMRIVTSVQFVGEKDITWGIMSEGLWA